MYIIGGFFMLLSAAVSGIFAFLDLMQNGTPFMGVILFTCGVCFAGGWIAIAMELDDE